jgi:catechol 2,3-dioxygenase-like lactoylglutathione lyase family enzyme
LAKIRHIAIFTDDPERLAEFYVDCFGMTVTQRPPPTPGGGVSVWLTDGYMDVALINPEYANPARGINHFGFTVDAADKPGIYERMKIAPFVPPPGRPHIEDAVRDPDGNKFDVSTTGLRDLTAEDAKETEEV